MNNERKPSAGPVCDHGHLVTVVLPDGSVLTVACPCASNYGRLQPARPKPVKAASKEPESP